MTIYEEVEKRHAQYQDGAITLSELINTLIALGISRDQLIVSEGCFHDNDGSDY